MSFMGKNKESMPTSSNNVEQSITGAPLGANTQNVMPTSSPVTQTVAPASTITQQSAIQGQTQSVTPTTSGAGQAQVPPAVQNTNVQPNPAATTTSKNNGQKEERGRLKSFKYTVINAMNKKEKGTFEAEDIAEVRNYLESQDYKVVELKPRSAADIDITGPPKLKAEDLSFALTQLSTYIKAGIPLVDTVKILAKQSTKPAHKKIWGQVVYELLHGESFSVALSRQNKVFPPLLVNMVKTAEMTGDLPSILDDMSEYYTTMNATRKQMISAMTYPTVVLCVAMAVLMFMLIYLVPQFTSMFESNDAKLPAITLAVLGVSDFVKQYWYMILIGIAVFIGLFIYLYKNVVSFRRAIQTVLMKLPVVSSIIIYNEIANFTKTFASLINHGVFITDSMEILSKITNNEVYKEIIDKTLKNLSKGDTVSSAFRGQWAIPVVAYEMIVTGENTGQLGLMLEKVANHFQTLHKSVIDQMKSLMEPFMMIILAAIVAVILLSIVTPMFSIYSQIK